MKEFIVGIGEALWDMLPDGKKIGGAPANFAYHAAQMGLDSCAVSAIGQDTLGDELIEKLEGRKVNYLIERVPYETGTVQVTLNDEGVPQYEIKEGVAWDNVPFTPALEELAKRTRAVCFGSLAQRHGTTHATVQRFLDTMPKGEGYYRIFDINLRQSFYTKEVIEKSFRQCNILKINDEEIIAVARLLDYDTEDFDTIAERLRSTYEIPILILTCGTNGSYIYTDEGVSFIETPTVAVADTVGAGDSFTAAFVSSILKGKSIAEAHQKAVEISAYVCTQHGAMPAYPT